MLANVSALRELFRSEFGHDAQRMFFAPGRINLIGEHIDYLGGPVLPGAIDRGVTALVASSRDRRLRLRSLDFAGEGLIPLDHLSDAPGELPHTWTAYCVGIARLLPVPPTELPGADILFASDLPVGSGLSSSAAMEVLTGYALLSLAAGPDPVPLSDADRIHLALLSQRAENEYVGVSCGIMDQFAVAVGRRDHLLHLNTQNLSWEPIPFHSADYALMVLNSNRPRQLHASRYNDRRAECDAALRTVQASRPGLTSLVDVTEEDIDALGRNSIGFKRARHARTEARRVQMAVDSLRADNMIELGRLLIASHESLRNDFDVSSTELDILHEESMRTGLCAGERMMGAGFGGCSIALIQRGEDEQRAFTDQVGQAYHRRTGSRCDIFPVHLDDGVREIC